MSKLTLEEKRLHNLRMQLFGKERPVSKSAKIVAVPGSMGQTETTLRSSIPNHAVDSAFLRQDLVKVFVLSTFLIGSQLVLYFLSLKGMIQLNIFHIF